MPIVLTGANLANSELIYLGVSGDGDSASIGLGQFAHAIRRGVNMAYIVENNGVYGLTKGQFSATSDKGSKTKKGVVNHDAPIDLVGLALQLGATFVARSFSGDKDQLVPLIKAALHHQGAAFIDCISPCVQFNNHTGSTKSFDYVREHNEAVNRHGRRRRPRAPIHVDYAAGHGGAGHPARRLGAGPAQAGRATTTPPTAPRPSPICSSARPRARSSPACSMSIPRPATCTTALDTVDQPLNTLGDAELTPGAAALDALNASFR